MTAALLVFLSIFALSFVWTFCTKAMVEDRAGRASLWASAYIGINGYAAIQYVQDKALLLPAVLGALAGTYLSMRLEKWRKTHEQSGNETRARSTS